MTREQIETAAGEYSGSVLGFKDNPVVMDKHKAFTAGAEWLADYLCKIPFNEIIDELHEYCANELKENSYDTGKCI